MSDKGHELPSSKWTHIVTIMDAAQSRGYQFAIKRANKNGAITYGCDGDCKISGFGASIYVTIKGQPIERPRHYAGYGVDAHEPLQAACIERFPFHAQLSESILRCLCHSHEL